DHREPAAALGDRRVLRLHDHGHGFAPARRRRADDERRDRCRDRPARADARGGGLARVPPAESIHALDRGPRAKGELSTMAHETPFDFVCGQIERATELSTLEARGTVRLALKAAGMDPKSVGASQMRVVLEKVMPGELKNRGCPDP